MRLSTLPLISHTVMRIVLRMIQHIKKELPDTLSLLELNTWSCSWIRKCGADATKVGPALVRFVSPKWRLIWYRWLQLAAFRWKALQSSARKPIIGDGGFGSWCDIAKSILLSGRLWSWLVLLCRSYWKSCKTAEDRWRPSKSTMDLPEYQKALIRPSKARRFYYSPWSSVRYLDEMEQDSCPISYAGGRKFSRFQHADYVISTLYGMAILTTNYFIYFTNGRGCFYKVPEH